MGLKSALQRRELFEFVLRMASQWVARVSSEKEKLSDHLQKFLNRFIRPVYDTSVIVIHRKEIQESKHLNQFLYDNFTGIKAIFEAAK